jgi:RNA polymerase sigma-70 factor (ECF subfamily)
MPYRQHLRVLPPAPERRDLTVAGSTDLSTLFLEYGRYVATIAFRILGRHDDLDDIVQDVFLAAHRGLQSVRDPEAVRSWLATVTVRMTRRRLRARRMRAFLRLDSDDESHDCVDRGAAADMTVVLAPVFQALDMLPTPARLAWSLRYLEGEPLARVAKLSGCSLAAVKRRLTKAKLVMDKVIDDL